MQAMMSMLMPPKLKSVTFESTPAAGTTANVTESSFDSNNMFMMMALSGGLGNSENSMLPLMFLMKK
jgi:hypothetical protein